ncbi:MAG: methyl-accepting chemotaxis sensory transducer [Fibrobacteres bacterium]|nr:methyl-accepting chemotaxis sensory transducer [Fibrobacterota bacterium]
MNSMLRQPRGLAKIGALALVFLLSFSLYGLYCINTVTEVKINGPHYKRIIQGKDIIADVLPPPEYLIESYLTAFEMMHAGDSAESAGLEARLARLGADYRDRHAHWAAALTEGELGRILLEESYRPGLAMLGAIDSQFLPALHAGDKVLAATVLDVTIKREYQLHRRLIDSVVALAKVRNRDDEARAAVVVRSRIYGQIAVGLFLLILLVFFSAYVIQNVEPAQAGADYPRDAPATRA